MVETDARERIMVALDCDRTRALELGRALSGSASWVKVGMTLFYAEGPAIVRDLKELGFKVFLDLKFHDIPHQVEGAARAAARAGADLLTAHGLGSAAMLRAARAGVEGEGSDGARPRVIAVTILTSMDAAALASIGVTDPVEIEVGRLAELARTSGMDGIVCSPMEARGMRALLGPDALVVCPGVRPAGSAAGDQSRVATPAAAIGAGASHIVVGRPITQAPDPLAALEGIVAELTAADITAPELRI
ncbi:MAG: orotidine-5'-phosphate decarboxylase [Collinsella sp.]|nr:orotidine-5'-phosphate decarboxylase [Collinsella sp.]